MVAVLIILALGAGYYFYSGTPAEPAMDGDAMTGERGETMTDEDTSSAMPVPGTNTEEMVTSDQQGNNEASMMEDVVEISVSGKNFAFTPSMFSVKKGQKVRLTFTSMSGFHDLVIDELNVKTKQLQEGSSDTIEFVAERTGTFEFYCSIGSHRALGMVGSISVTE